MKPSASFVRTTAPSGDVIVPNNFAGDRRLASERPISREELIRDGRLEEGAAQSVVREQPVVQMPLNQTLPLEIPVQSRAQDYLLTEGVLPEPNSLAGGSLSREKKGNEEQGFWGLFQ
jgi:hypothetical protein